MIQKLTNSPLWQLDSLCAHGHPTISQPLKTSLPTRAQPSNLTSQLFRSTFSPPVSSWRQVQSPALAVLGHIAQPGEV